jgi:myosin-5
VDLSQFGYLSESGCYEIPKIDDVQWFKEVVEALGVMGISEGEQRGIWTTLAIVLSLGNVTFDETEYLADNHYPCKLTPQGRRWLDNCARLLDVSLESLLKPMTNYIRLVGKVEIVSPIKLKDCLSFRDSLAKALYDRLFDWLIKRLNRTIQAEGQGSLGLLDIFGFELLQVNSFEQFCINYANEKLHQLYIEFVFKAEEAEFRREALTEHLSQLEFVDNQGILDLIEGSLTGRRMEMKGS